MSVVCLPRKITEEAVSLVKEYEGFRPIPYKKDGTWTIGYGHTRTVRQDMKVSKEQAEQLLEEDLRIASRSVERKVTVPLNDNQHAALVSFVFNVGSTNFEGSTLLKLLNRGWYEQVPAQLARWHSCKGAKLEGLKRRREAEARLWKKRPQTSETNIHSVWE